MSMDSFETVYPRRSDGVVAVKVDCTTDQAQGLSDFLGVSVRIVRAPRDYPSLEIHELNGSFRRAVPLGQRVVISPIDRVIVDVLDDEDFHAKYSKDGS